MKLLKLEVRTYIGKEYKDYINNQSESEDPENSWRANSIEVPKSTPSKMIIFDPKIMQIAIESSSLEAMEENPENPKHDSVDLYTSDGLILTLMGGIDKFEKTLEKFFSEEKCTKCTKNI